MTDEELAARIESALNDADVVAVTFALAVQFRDEGMSQDRLTRLFDASLQRHRADADETKYDAVLDALANITGWCSPAAALYPRKER